MKLSARLCQIAVPLIAGLLAGANVASASSIYTYSTYTVPGEQTIMITSPADTFAGMGQIDLDGTGASAGIDIMAWCLDPYSALLGNGNGGSGPFTYNITQPLLPSTVAAGFGTSMSSPSGMLSATQIAEIGGLMAYGNANIGTANVSAAAQLAIWEVEYGSNFSFTGVSDATSSFCNHVDRRSRV